MAANNDSKDFEFLFDLASDDEEELFGSLPLPGTSPRRALLDEGLDKPDNPIEESIKMLKTRRKPAQLNNDQCEQRLAALINIMREAKEDDEIAHKQDQPCVHKLKVLPVLQRELCREELRDGFVVAGGIDVLNNWVTLLEDGTKPSDTIVIGILKLLRQLPVSTMSIKVSNIGKTVAAIFKDGKNAIEIRRSAEDLISHWLRPMLGLNSSYSVMIEQNQEALRHGMTPTAVIDGGLSPRAGGVSPSVFGFSPKDRSNDKRFRPQPFGSPAKAKFYTSGLSPASSTPARGRVGEDLSPGAGSATGSPSKRQLVKADERRHAMQLQKATNNFVALPDYEHIKYKRLSKRKIIANRNKDTRRNRLTKAMLKNKVVTDLARPHRRDTVEVAYLKRGANIQEGGF